MAWMRIGKTLCAYAFLHISSCMPAFGQPVGGCQVTTEGEFRTALSAACNPITVAGNIDVENSLVITPNNNGLALSIEGTLTWIGPPADNPNLTYGMLEVSGSSDNPVRNVTISGGGLLTSIYDPCRNCVNPCTDPTTGHIYIADAIRLRGADEIIISNLEFSNLSRMVHAEAAGATNTILINLMGVDISRYGMFIVGDGILVENCHSEGPMCGHGFRFYANNVDVLNSSSTATDTQGSGAGLWFVEGTNCEVDQFETTNYVQIGPNFATADAGERLVGVTARAVTAGEGLRVTYGTFGAYFEGITGPSFSISIPSQNGRPTDRIHWRGVPACATYDCFNANEPCIGLDIGCLGDVTDDGFVNVTDLLKVIAEFNTTCEFQAQTTPCPMGPPSCPVDIFPPPVGDGVVNVSDLVAVIADWNCGITNPEPAPSVDDCNENGLVDFLDIYNGLSLDCNRNGIPDECDCLADVIYCDGEVNVSDLLEVIGEWGVCSVVGACRADIAPTITGDGFVNDLDMDAVLEAWGPCPGGEAVPSWVQDCVDEFDEGLINITELKACLLAGP